MLRTRTLFKALPVPLSSIVDRQKETQHRRNVLIRLGFMAAILGTALAFLSIIKTNERVAEWFTRYISRFLVSIGGHISSLFPWFSLFELLIFVIITVGIVLLIKLILSLKKRRFYAVLRALCIVVCIVLGCLNYYTVCAGFSYYRAPLNLPKSEIVYRGQDVKDIADYFYDDFIALSASLPRDQNGDAIPPYSTLTQLAEKLQREFERLSDNDYFHPYTPRAKVIQNSWLMSSTRISGIAFLPTGEANVNGMPHPIDMPQTMAHELAHTKGVMRENEANLVSYYILLTSDDPYLRYCGYISAIHYMRDAAYDGNNRNQEIRVAYSNKFPAAAAFEESRAWRFWREYVGPFNWANDLLARAGTFFNDLYLRLNGADDGTDSYNQPPSDSIDSGQQDPDTGEQIYDPVYTDIQKIFFRIYENTH